MYDLMMVARSRTTRITHLFCDKPNVHGQDKVHAYSQGYSKGNVAIFPQDVASVRPLLPPPRDEIKEAMCALFVGPKTVPTRENIKDLRPVLVSKTRVQSMIDFLLTRNPYYINSGVEFSQSNLDDLFPEPNEAFPSAIDICCLPDGNEAVPTSYADRGDQQPGFPGAYTEVDDGTVVVDAVGYTVGENTPNSHRDMKAAAVAWCLDKKNFVKMQTGSKFITDRDPGLLTTDLQHITSERQVKNMLLQHDDAFQKDANFAYVCWNIIQKKEPSNRAEKRTLRTLNKLKLIAKDLKGSSGYKQCRRNELRAMMKKMATPALFMTLNPADILDPLLGAMGGIDPGEWAKMTSTARKVFIAQNPATAAVFFDEIIQAFIKIVLSYDPASMLRLLWYG
ncbi:hypothetical protein DFH06DRAFT_1269127 [Mycena polygramma]|nr:hypothetical protein DFH06DRAFT_1269127 [Mycena polygramma]